MEKQAPTFGRIAIMVAFVLSCFGLGLYLWVAWGGSTPLAPKPYRISIPFDEATQLADQADVRIAGVSVGKVADINLPPDGSQAVAEVDIDARYAPLPENTQAILRLKTLLGETYVELTQGDREAPDLPEGATLPKAQIGQTVQIDEVLQTFDKETREAFQVWMRDSSIAIDGQGQALGDAFATLPTTFREFEDIFLTLDRQENAVKQIFSNGAITFDALRGRNGELADLIRGGNAVLETTADRDQQIMETFRAFPAFLDESRLTLGRLREFSANADPLMQQLTPAARELSPTLEQLARLAPELEGTFKGLRPVIRNAPQAFPAFRKMFRKDFPPALRALGPFLRNVNPLFEIVKVYRRELAALIGNATAATNFLPAQEEGGRVLRTMGTVSPDTYATFPNRPAYSRVNPYLKAGSYSELASGLEGFVTAQCSSGLTAELDPGIPTDPDFVARMDGDAAKAQELFDRIKRFSFADSMGTASVPSPACTKQGKFKPFGQSSPKVDYPQANIWPKGGK